MQIRWMFRAMEAGFCGPNPNVRGTLACYEDEKPQKELAVLIKFVPDDKDAKERKCWVHNVPEPAAGGEVEFVNAIFRVYRKLPVPEVGTEVRTTVASVKVPLRVV